MNVSTLAAALGNVMFAQDEPFIGSFMFFAIMGVLFLGLIGLLLFMRNRQAGDD